MKISDYEVEHYLRWGLNYGEIARYSLVAPSGRKWMIELPRAGVTASGVELGLIERSVVPQEMVLTSREALVFGMGLAVGGSRPRTRAEHAATQWGWGRRA